LLTATAILLLDACQKPSINFGTTFTNENTTNVVAIDTFSVRLSTVLVDSFATAATGNLLVGRYNDPYFGVVTSKSYLQVTPPTNLPIISNLASYDSLSLILRINKGFYGDTTKVQRYTVSQLTSVIELPGTQITFYSNSKIPYDPSPLGYSDVQINPTAFFTSQRLNDSLKIKLPDSQGLELFNLLYNQSDTVKNVSTFLGYFKGFAIYPDDNSVGSIFGFRDTVIMRLYYHEPGLVYTPKFVDFTLNNKQFQFNQITYDRTGTPSAPIDSLHDEVASTATGNAAFIQGTTGLEMKIRFPTIGNLLQFPDYLSILKAQLTIKPVAGTYSPTLALPPQLAMSMTDPSNIIGPTLPFGSGNLVVDYLYGANTAYTYDITPYIKQQILLGPIYNANNGIMLYVPLPANNTSFNRVVVGDQFTPKDIDKINLKIYYASFY
jgi:hypothetical protein